jgi:hypothetical protein
MICFGFISLQEGLQMGYHEPHLPPWVIVYWVFILKYFWNILNKSLQENLFKSLKISSHYYVMVYI